MNSFGKRFKFTTFGESHGKALGCIVDGVPAGLDIPLDFIQDEMDKRKPGGKYATSRKESDTIEILSGVFEGKSTGTSIAILLFNENQKSRDYDNVKDLFRPGHADFTYFNKYGIRDYRGGGRSSARETSARVAAGAIAKLILKQVGVEIKSGVSSIGGINSTSDTYDYDFAQNSEIFALDQHKEVEWKEAIIKAKKSHDSIGGIVSIKATNVPAGLGEPVYYKLDSVLADAMMSINAVKALEIGDGFNSVNIRGSQNNDQIDKNGFKTNHSGGILGGISNGSDIQMKVYFKPTPSIFISQDTVDINNDELECKLKGRHDPCVATRGSVVASSMMAIVLADMLLLNMSSKIENIQKVYNS
jgi:chorismate synthase